MLTKVKQSDIVNSLNDTNEIKSSSSNTSTNKSKLEITNTKQQISLNHSGLYSHQTFTNFFLVIFILFITSFPGNVHSLKLRTGTLSLTSGDLEVSTKNLGELPIAVNADTISTAKTTTTSTNTSKVGTAFADANNGGTSAAQSTAGNAISKATGTNAISNAQADDNKNSLALASTQSDGGSALASAINNSNSIATSEGKNSDATALAQDNGSSEANAKSKSLTVGFSDSLSKTNLTSDATSKALAVSKDNGTAKADSNSLSGSIGIAVNGGQANADTKANSNAKAYAGEDGVAKARSDSNTIGFSVSKGPDSVSDLKGKNDVNSVANVGYGDELLGVGGYKQSVYLGNPVDYNMNYANTDKTSKDVGGNIKTDASGKQNQNIKQQNQNEADILYQDWESIYFNRNRNRYISHKMQNFVSTVQVSIQNNNDIKAEDLVLPKQVTSDKNSKIGGDKIVGSSDVTQSSNQVQSIQDNCSTINYFDTNIVAVDIGIGSEGDLYAVGLDGYLYVYYSVENTWEKIEGDFDLANLAHVDVGLDGTPYVANTAGETYYLTCEHKWVKLPGCARDIGAGRGGEVYKIGCERRNGGFKVHKLICKQEAKKCSRCQRYIKKCDTCYTFESDGRKCKWFAMDGAGVRIDVHPNGHPFIVDDQGKVQFYDGTEWNFIPGTSAFDLSVSNEGMVYYVASDYTLRKIVSKKFNKDYSQVYISMVGNRSAIAVTTGPYSQPIIISDGYKVLSAFKQGFN